MELHMVFQIVGIALQVLLMIALADIVVGAVHWAEDTLGDVDTPIWGPLLVKPNERHHRKPTALLRKKWCSSTWKHRSYRSRSKRGRR